MIMNIMIIMMLVLLLHYHGGDGVLNGINYLVNLGHLQVVPARDPNLSSNEPSYSHGLANLLPIPSEYRELAPGHVGLDVHPGSVAVPGHGQPLVLTGILFQKEKYDE